MGKMFGTDGVRGRANEDLTPELAFRLGQAAGTLFRQTGEKKNFVLGRDTRLSGTMLEAALAAGICSVGLNVYLTGVMPTPAIAYLTRTLDNCAGAAVISASHNPAPDNGIKFFNNLGFKLDDVLEEKIEEMVLGRIDISSRPTGSEVGRIIHLEEALTRYIEFLKKTVTVDLNGYRIVVDCANGAAYQAAPRALMELGAQVISINDLPDGLNINDCCGSTYTLPLQEAVLKYEAQLGFAYDGDADRVIAVDEKGNIVDGDRIILICGLFLKKQQLLKDKVVVTVMSNLGLRNAFQEVGIEVFETAVGDRYVLEKMQKTGAVLGGEQSGHIIFLQHNTTGDGLLTSLQLLQAVKDSGSSLSQLAEKMEVFPQLLINVRVGHKDGWDQREEIKEAIKKGEQSLQQEGRLLVRASGTEPLIRVMAEGRDENKLRAICDEIASVIEKVLNPNS